jgi:AraC family transcriptional regulator, exoenzyme S synthesis regulatory protein ExsA
MIVFGNTPYAKHNRVTQSTGKQVGFLTEHTVFFILQGKKHIHFGDHIVTVEEGSITLLPKGIYTISEYIPEDGCFEALMLFIPEHFFTWCQKVFQVEKAGIDNPQRTVVIPMNQTLSAFCTQYLSYFAQRPEYLEHIVYVKLQELFYLLLSTPARAQFLGFIAERLSKSHLDVEYIVREHLLQPLTLSEFATLSGRSLAAFKRDFHDKFGSAPMRWINKERLCYAQGLIRSTGKSISEIAHDCGFESISHFTKIFKKEFQVIPSRFRAELTNN